MFKSAPIRDTVRYTGCRYTRHFAVVFEFSVVHFIHYMVDNKIPNLWVNIQYNLHYTLPTVYHNATRSCIYWRKRCSEMSSVVNSDFKVRILRIKSELNFFFLCVALILLPYYNALLLLSSLLLLLLFFILLHTCTAESLRFPFGPRGAWWETVRRHGEHLSLITRGGEEGRPGGQLPGGCWLPSAAAANDSSSTTPATTTTITTTTTTAAS